MRFETLKSHALKDLKKYTPDADIAKYLAAINANPNVVTRGSCSGMYDKQWEDAKNHGGHPYLWVAFSSPRAASYYASKLTAVGLAANPIHNDTGNSLYIEIPNTTNGRGGASIASGPNPRRASPMEAQRFWRVVTQILSR